MTRKTARRGTREPHSSTLPFNPADLVAMRVTPAKLAEICNVSRQSVSKWVKNGWVTLGPDGLVDPKVAIRQYMDCVDPAKMRVRVLRDATASIPELRARIQSLEAAVVAAGEAAANRCRDDFARRSYRFCSEIEARFTELQAAYSAGTAGQWLEELEGLVFWDLEPGDDADDAEAGMETANDGE